MEQWFTSSSPKKVLQSTERQRPRPIRADDMPKVLLITKIRTSNIGNEALSSELITLFQGLVGTENLRVEGRPRGLDGYQLSRLAREANPTKLFEGWADDIARQFRADSSVTHQFKPELREVELTDFHSSKWNLERVKAWLRPLKRYLTKWTVLSAVYRRRLEHISSSDWLIYSGAGEVGDNNVFLRQLVELRVAQKLGKKTAVVNQSIVVTTPLVRSMVSLVYGNLKHAVVRGARSRDLLLSLKVPSEIIDVAPDTALRTQASVETNPAVSPQRVGINFTRRLALNMEAVQGVVNKLRGLGYDLVFVSNEPYEDDEVAVVMNSMFGVPRAAVTHYKSYAAFLKEFAFVISARLHTNILALTAGTPVIPIEGNVFKTSELLELLDYPVKVIRSSDQNWCGQLEKEVMNVHSGRYDFDSYFRNTLPEHTERVARNASWLNSFVTQNV